MAPNGNTRNNQIRTSNCPNDILKTIPTGCVAISFSQLIAGQNFNNKAIIGKIKHLFPIGKRANGYIRKLLVTDALEKDPDCEMRLAVFLLDEFARDSEAAELEGFIILTNFILEKSSRAKSNELPLQALVDREKSQVLQFGRTVVTHSQTTEKRIPIKKKKTKRTSDPSTASDSNEDSDVDIIPTKKKKTKRTSDPSKNPPQGYDYVPISQLKETEDTETFNIYAVIEKCSLKQRTQSLGVVLTDETKTGFSCNVFAAKDEIFPDVYPGDILRVHRMKVRKFRSNLTGSCPSAKFVLVFPKSNQGKKPRTVAKSFTFTPDDATRVKSLFEWYNQKNAPRLISELNRNDFANIISQVIGVYRAKTANCVILKIWDGTKTSVIESSHLGFREENIDEKLFLVAKHHYVNLHVYSEHAAVAAELKPLQYIEVRDAHVFCPQSNPDDCKLCLHSGNVENRGLVVLQESDERVVKLKERLEEITSQYFNIADQTDDLLSQNNSIFLNCDISAFASSQKEPATEINSDNKSVEPEIENGAADIEILNHPLTTNDEMSASQVVSVVDASVRPGESTQEFGRGLMNEIQEKSGAVFDNVSQSVEPDPVLNKTPLELKMFLHNPKTPTLQVNDDNHERLKSTSAVSGIVFWWLYNYS